MLFVLGPISLNEPWRGGNRSKSVYLNGPFSILQLVHFLIWTKVILVLLSKDRYSKMYFKVLLSTLHIHNSSLYFLHKHFDEMIVKLILILAQSVSSAKQPFAQARRLRGRVPTCNLDWWSPKEASTLPFISTAWITQKVRIIPSLKTVTS